MREFFYRDTEGGSRRLVGPFGTEEEAKKAARYKGIRNVEVLVKNGTNYDLVGMSHPDAGSTRGASKPS